MVSQTPNNPPLMAQDLKTAVSNSGLFYESHLNSLVHGQRALAAIMQEPQNQANPPVAALLSQQLTMLDSQQISWRGDVWPGQAMDLDVYLPTQNAEPEGRGQSNKEHAKDPDSNEAQSNKTTAEHAEKPIASEMKLHFPNLGQVTARLSLVDGRMRIQIRAEQPQSFKMLESKRLALAEAITNNGQQLDALIVTQHG